jgi:putative salt-induced outer membrane protein YdiY
MNRRFLIFASIAIAAVLSTTVPADVVTLKNGDKITGTVGQIADGKMDFKSPVLGEIKIDMANVETFTTDAPVDIRMKGKQPDVTGKVAEGDAAKYKTQDGREVAVSEVKVFNPPPRKWTGSVLLNSTLARGNTDSFDLGFAARAELRRDEQPYSDRFLLAAEYNYGTTGRGDNTTTDTDNWMAGAKYDKFWTEKWYGYANFEADHDRIAAINYRLKPGVGVGYQWYETPSFKFNTEAGVSYVYQDFDPGGHDDYVALRLAYHLEKQVNESFTLFHNLEWLPAFEDPGDYLLATDAGVRAKLTKQMFSEFKVEWNRDSTPAPDSLKNDLRYVLGLGWAF